MIIIFRLAITYFEEDEELYELASYCLTETVKSNLKQYFNSGYEKLPDEKLHEAVSTPDIIDILPPKLYEEMTLSGIDVDRFLAKKAAQMMIQLNDKEKLTFDLFNEYLLYQMTVHTNYSRSKAPACVLESIPKLRELLEEAVLKEYSYLNEYAEKDKKKLSTQKVEESIKLLTSFKDLLYVDDKEYSFAFWDWDFSFLDDWGFEKVLYEAAFGLFGQKRGYGKEYTLGIFTSVGEEIPNFLKC